jgi:fructose-1,6-bisphosphatase/inositol monophosphatase family enzyme
MRPSQELLKVSALMRRGIEDIALPIVRGEVEMTVKVKGPNDFQTNGDTDIETFLKQGVAAIRPDPVVGEEAVSADPLVLTSLARKGGSWVIDPIDGTLFFKQRQPHFGSLVSHSQDGETRAGYMLDIYQGYDGLDSRMVAADESGVWYSPSRSAPFVALKPFAERAVPLRKPTGSTTTSYFVPGILREDTPARLQAGTTKIAWDDEPRAAARFYIEMALGQTAAVISPPARTWDHAAGTFIVEKLGGVARVMSTGARSRPTQVSGGIVCANSADMADRAMADLCRPLDQWRGKEPCIERYYTVPDNGAALYAALETLGGSKLRGHGMAIGGKVAAFRSPPV